MTHGQPAFGTLLRRLRLAAGLTQEELAERSSISERGISDLERGINARPRPYTVRQLADALRLSANDQQALIDAANGLSAPKPSPPHNLPFELTPLIGRERELAHALHLLRSGGVRLLTLTGPGGVGKTRLALAIAGALLDDVPDGVVIVELAPVRDQALVLPAVASTLGLREEASRPLLETVTDYVRTRTLLLFLDNVEQVIGAAPQLVALLTSCPALRLLVTSRMPLHVRGEQELAVKPLAVPEPRAGCSSSEPIAHYPAVTLFVQRAQAVKPDFALTVENSGAVARLCRDLDGLPLAIELAAAQVKFLSPRQLQGHYKRRLDLLTTGAQDLPPRQRTMRDAIAWSYDLLAAEQKLFCRLAVFVGGCDLAAVTAVCGGPGDLALDPLRGLLSLVDKSLVTIDEHASGETSRFGMLETIREYAQEQLDHRGETEATCRRHALHYVALAEAIAAKLGGVDEGRWMAQLDAELPNLRAALRWATAHEPVLALRLGKGLRRYWFSRGYLREGLEALERALDAASAGEAPAPLRAYVLTALGWLAIHLGAFDSGAARMEAAAEIRRALGDQLGLAQALHGLAAIAEYRGDDVLATAHYEEVLALSREAKNHAMVVEMLDNLADAAMRGNDVERAALLSGEALVVSHEAGVPTMAVAQALIGAVQIACAQGDYARASTLIREALERARDAGNRLTIADALAGCAAIAVGVGQPAQAVRLLGATTALAEAAGASRVIHQEQYSRALAAAQSALDGAAFDAAWTSGKALSPEDAIAEALAESRGIATT